METSKLILIGNIVSEESSLGILRIDTESKRIFFSQETEEGELKHFSFQFPFKIEKIEERLFLRTCSIGIEIQNAHLQVILSLVNKGILSSHRGVYGIQLEFSELIEDTLSELSLPKSLSEDLSDILLELFLFEPGYIRFDEDKKNADGARHPHYHFDIFYSQMTSLKIGSSKLLSNNDFMDFICRRENNCYYIQ